MHLYERKKEALHMTGEEYIKSLSGEEFLKAEIEKKVSR